ncbi:tetratricopeptide repeat protein [Candidatus Spongiihabitans sp.]|uniref:tetratricopeptide repeat protein n=1 Tax=Candidatus Spongiihabitans sp. TaxID=3101308 RepID=UPI003C7A7064
MMRKIARIFGVVPQTSSKNIAALRAWAELGHAWAQYSLGRAYWKGEEIDEDKREAEHWYRLAAEQGHTKAQLFLGVAYDNGEGVTMDKREAARWWRMAAEQGVAEAQTKLGDTYYFGERSDSGKRSAGDKREGVRWYRKAAAQGHMQAQTHLGFAYCYGIGVIMDKSEAYIWWSIAKVNGNRRAAKFLHENNWRKHLSKNEICSAQKEAAARLEEIENRKE